MIPGIVHSRSQLFSYFNDFEDGACVFEVSRDTYPQLFELAYSTIVRKAPHGWKSNSKGNCRYLWFPANALDEDDIEKVKDWQARFEQYVLLGLNPHLEGYFSTELDFCMAPDFNFDPSAGKRTLYGEAEYQFKYQGSRQHFAVLGNALIEAIADLPISVESRQAMCLTCIPAPLSEPTVSRRLAAALARKLSLDFVDADLQCPKAPLKQATVAEKIPIWENLYRDGCVVLSGSVNERLVIVIDDLYQSGATMWGYAGFLKSQGAAHVLGLACVKSLRDSDNS